MKCPICSAENAPEASSCHKCGFSLSFSKPVYPNSPKWDDTLVGGVEGGKSEIGVEQSEARHQKDTSIPNNTQGDDKTTKLVIWGIVILIVGIVLIAIMFFSFSRSAASAEFSHETIVVGAKEEFLLEFKTEEGRYDWSITSNSYFDGYQIVGEDFSAYKAGEEFSKAGEVEDVMFWAPFLQTGGGMAGIIIVNNGDEDLSAVVRTTFRHNPPLYIVCLFPLLGVLASFGGLITIIIGVVQKIRGR